MTGDINSDCETNTNSHMTTHAYKKLLNSKKQKVFEGRHSSPLSSPSSPIHSIGLICNGQHSHTCSFMLMALETNVTTHS